MGQSGVRVRSRRRDLDFGRRLGRWKFCMPGSKEPARAEKDDQEHHKKTTDQPDGRIIQRVAAPRCGHTGYLRHFSLVAVRWGLVRHFDTFLLLWIRYVFNLRQIRAIRRVFSALEMHRSPFMGIVVRDTPASNTGYDGNEVRRNRRPWQRSCPFRQRSVIEMVTKPSARLVYSLRGLYSGRKHGEGWLPRRIA